MNLYQLETFLTVARVKSFTRAAPLVGLSQSAVSRQIQELESSIGMPLFERFARQISLTEAGRVLQAEAPRLLQQAKGIRERLQDLHAGACGEVRIGATVSTANTLLPQVLTRFRRTHRDVRLKLEPGHTPRLLKKLRENELDVAVVGTEVKDPDLKICHRIPDELVLVAAPTHALAKKKRVTLRELEGVEVIHREPGADSRHLFEQWLGKQQIQLHNLMDLW